MLTSASPRGASISAKDVTLDYPLGPVTRRSIKQQLFSLFGGGREAEPPGNIRALNGVSFEIASGERVGIIGTNGSGKSTLLRAMAGVYPITGGQLIVRGAIQGMFDINLGFELEATGFENILYRGLVMGLSPTQIRARQDEIIEFAELGDFIHLPVRTYSSGMAVRLAFAISTYLQGNVLLLDEMLGAGDAAFQVKAAARMRNLVHSAEILVLVSHDIATIRNVCTRTIWLSAGKVMMDGDTTEVTTAYLNATRPEPAPQPAS